LKANIEVVSQQMDAEKLKNGQARQGIKVQIEREVAKI